VAKNDVKTGLKATAQPVKSPITWFGGKARLAEQIVSLLTENSCFVDVFGGSAAILLARPPSRKRIDV
jgi:DNA adenine methylase